MVPPSNSRSLLVSFSPVSSSDHGILSDSSSLWSASIEAHCYFDPSDLFDLFAADLLLRCRSKKYIADDSIVARLTRFGNSASRTTRDAINMEIVIANTLQTCQVSRQDSPELSDSILCSDVSETIRMHLLQRIIYL